jgi:eukaryotic-like serine/threonine-protein kinase
MSEEAFHKKKTLPGLQPSLHPKLVEDQQLSQGQRLGAGFTETPKMIGPYKIESLLEKGGMSYLYLGIHPETQELTTIKVLSPRFNSHPEAVKRFLNEAEIIAMADHPNIIKLYGHGEWEGGLYIAMEFIQGCSLRQTLLQNPISLKRALEIVIDIAYALCHLHTHGVIHRDLKPENILLTESGQVKVIDFGIAQLLTEKSAPGFPSKQRIIGTPIYMSPEQRENPEAVSYPSDIYSLGIISYELILGKLSHGQIHLSLMPKGIQKILNKALQPLPRERYQDMVDFITDVSTYLHSTNFEKEKKVGDQLSELSENLKHVQQLLTCQSLTDHLKTHLKETDGMEMGIAFHQGINLHGLYSDFFELNDGEYGFILAESSAKGAEAVVYSSMVRGMVQSLKHTANTPLEMAQQLNRLIYSDQTDEFMSFGYLLLAPRKNQARFIQCGSANLWRLAAENQQPLLIPSPNIALGIDPEAVFRETVLPFQMGDAFILCSDTPFNFEAGSQQENMYLSVLQENVNHDPQTIVDAILRKIKLIQTRQLPAQTFTFLCVRKVK